MKLLLRFLFFLTLSLLIIDTTKSGEILSGKVTDGSQPVADAFVKLQNLPLTTTTNHNGKFELEIEDTNTNRIIIAWKEGYFNSHTSIENKSNIEIILTPLPDGDNPAYTWIDPTPNASDDTYNCSDCHVEIHRQWSATAHANSTSNSIFMDVYNGTNAEGQTGYQPGYRLDYPYSNGNCANCHAPIAAIDNQNFDFNNLQPSGKLGITCDFCHKVQAIHLKENTTVNTGVMMMEVLRPPEEQPAFFGPHENSPQPYAFSLEISKSSFCAPCHQGSFWGVPIYESYSEWLNSPYVAKNIHCQDCHMPVDEAKRTVLNGKEAVERGKESTHSHLIKSPRDSTFLTSSVEMLTNAKRNENRLEVKVEIRNVGAGHHIPTGQPMRNMLLLVNAVDSDGKSLEFVGENVIPFWGGHGDPLLGNYEGLPGKGFAKILFEHYSQFVQLKLGSKWQHVFPAPEWRVVRVKSDTRIPAFGSDSSNYDFLLSGHKFPVTVTCKLIYRKTFKNWATAKKWPLSDLPVAENMIIVR